MLWAISQGRLPVTWLLICKPAVVDRSSSSESSSRISHGKGPVSFPEALDSVWRPLNCNTSLMFLAGASRVVKVSSLLLAFKEGQMFHALNQAKAHRQPMWAVWVQRLREAAAYRASLLSLVSVTDERPMVCHIAPDLAEHAAMSLAIRPCSDDTRAVSAESPGDAGLPRVSRDLLSQGRMLL